jgi:hypothetical protein
MSGEGDGEGLGNGDGLRSGLGEGDGLGVGEAFGLGLGVGGAGGDVVGGSTTTLGWGLAEGCTWWRWGGVRPTCGGAPAFPAPATNTTASATRPATATSPTA